MDKQKMKTSVAALSVTSNSILVALKLIIGLAIGSVSVISEAIHSGVDLVAAVIAMMAVRRSGRPADGSHSYGHGKIENIAGTIEAILIFMAAAWIIYESVRKLISPEHMEDVGWGIAVMTGSAAANFFVSRMLFRVGEKTDSIALKADGMHLRTDVYTSLGVMAGLLIYWLMKLAFPGTEILWIDPVAAILVALLIIKAAYELTRESAKDLIDARLPEEEEALVDRYVREKIPDACGYHNLRTRKSGPYRFFEFHLMVPGGLSVKESHDMGDSIVAKIKNHFPDARVVIHVEPCERICDEDCVRGCFILTDEQRAAIRRA